MFEVIFSALIITIIIAFIIENLKLNMKVRRIYHVNIKIQEAICQILKGKNDFDIFTVNDLRRVIDKELLNTKIIDEYELYKVNDITIRIIYNIGFVFQELELRAQNGIIKLIEKKLNYGRDD